MTDFDKTPPNDQQAERIVLGAMLCSTANADEGLHLLSTEDFYNPLHQVIFDAISKQADENKPTEIAAVNGRLLAAGKARETENGIYLFGCLEAARGAQVSYYAAVINEHAILRRTAKAAEQIHQRAMARLGETAAEVTGWAVDHLAAAVIGSGADETSDEIGADELMGEPPSHTWVIPGLIERGDRFLLTGPEGHGKSSLLRQLAVMTAAGIHPWTHMPTHQRKVLVVDCENGMGLTMRRYKPLLQAAGGAVGGFRLSSKPGGLDLAQKAAVGSLLRQVQRVNPDLLVIGPLYRLHAGDPNDERDARRVALALDKIRESVGCALVVEAHSPHAQNGQRRNLRPIGSSLWLRWPEFGYGIDPSPREEDKHHRASRLVPWRGPRDERAWPYRIRSGGTSTPWPWVIDGGMS